MTEEKELEATYGPAAPYSEHKRGEYIHYISADGTQQSGTIVWVQAPFQDIGIKYVIAPDVPGAFLDFVVPGDVLQVEDVAQEQEPVIQACPYCFGSHYDVEACPLKPKPSR